MPERMDHLIEPGIRDYFNGSFQQCKEYKMTYYTWIVNTVLFVLFVLTVTLILYFKRKKKLTPEQLRKRNEEDRMYIINKIRSLQIR
uniref:Uncharacterized protein n=1 Tax=viral metagenome TaxID=1070528 RepID=A0A6C0AGN0_9ZZZZ